MKRTWIVVVTVLTLMMTIGPVGVQAETNEKAEKDLKEIQGKQQKTKEQMNELVGKIEELKKKLTPLEEQVYETEEKLKETEKKRDKAAKEAEHYDAIFKKRLRAIYQSGEMGYMESLFRAKSFGEFLARFESIRIIAKNDREALDKYLETQEQYEKETEKLAKLKKEQEEQKDKEKQAYDELLAEMKKNQALLAKLNHEEKLKKEEIRKKNEMMSRHSSAPYTGGKLAWPTAATRVSCPYGCYQGHTGVDISGPIGTPVYAAESGTVVESRPGGGYGWMIVIKHDNGLATLYAHSWGHQVLVKKGQRVSRGQRITSIGNNGRSTGPHLHFEVHSGGRAVNPMPYLR